MEFGIYLLFAFWILRFVKRDCVDIPTPNRYPVLMTTVGHTLFGLSIGIGCMPQYTSVKSRVVFLSCFALIASIPDLPVPFWGHDWYLVSHGLFINSALITLILTVDVIPRSLRERIGGNRTLFYGVLAWLGHLALDSLYNHGNGIRIFWPLSDAPLILPLPWFSVLTQPWKSLHNPGVFLTEFLFYLPIVFIVAGLRRIYLRRRMTC